MIDTCQANTMYSKFYSPNIIATGSSEIDQSSYSHHADNDVGVAVIDRYTYYNLDFLETQVRQPTSKLTLADLFDSYDESKIHSHPGVRYDLLPGSEKAGRERLIMDFFGNVQNVEIESSGASNDTQWKDDLEQLGLMIDALKARDNSSEQLKKETKVAEVPATGQPWKQEVAAKVDDQDSWTNQLVVVSAVAVCAGIWLASSWIDSKQ